MSERPKSDTFITSSDRPEGDYSNWVDPGSREKRAHRTYEVVGGKARVISRAAYEEKNKLAENGGDALLATAGPQEAGYPEQAVSETFRADADEPVGGPQVEELINGPRAEEVVHGPRGDEPVSGPFAGELVHGPRTDELVNGPQVDEASYGPSIAELEEEEAPYGPGVDALYSGPLPEELSLPVYGPGQEELALGPLESQLFDKEDLLGRIDPVVLRNYETARDEYISAQTEARSGVGSLIDHMPVGKDWARRLHGKLSKGPSVDEYRDRITRKNYEAAHGALREAILAEYEKSVAIAEGQRNEFRMSLNAEEAHALEYAVSDKRLETDGERSLVSQKVTRLKVLGLATAVGALTAVADGWGKGNNHYAWLATAAVAGGVVGYRAEKAAGSNENSDDNIEKRAEEAAEYIKSSFSSGESMEDDAVVSRTIGYNTRTIQDEKFRRRTRTALGGAAIGVVAHFGADYLTDSGLNLNPFGGGEVDTGSPEAVQPTETPEPTEPAPTSTPESTPTPAPSPTPDSTPTQAPEPKPTPTPELTPTPTETPTAPATPPAESPGEIIDPQGGIDPRSENGTIDAEVPAETAEPEPEAPAAPEIAEAPREINVLPGDGFTDRVIGTAAESGVDLSPSQSYEVYEQLEQLGPDNIIDGAETYPMPDGDLGIVETGPASWEPEAQEIIDDYLEGDTNGDGVIDVSDAEAGAEIQQMPGSPVAVPEGGGFTHTLQNSFPGLSDAESYELYQYLDNKYGAENILTDVNVYQEGGEWRIHDSGSAKWATTDIEKDARQWVSGRGK